MFFDCSSFPVAVYALWLKDELDSTILPYMVHFSRERQQNILRYRVAADRSRTVFAELLARYLLCRVSNASPEDVFVERNAKGKPFGKVGRGNLKDTWNISLSHSGFWVVCSIGSELNGVDVETGDTDFEEIVRQFFLPKEAAALQRMSVACRKRAFLCDWTLKESCLKCTGEGLAWGDLSKIDCAALRKGTLDIVGKNFLLPDDAVIGICTRGDCLPIHIDFVSLDILKNFWKI